VDWGRREFQAFFRQPFGLQGCSGLCLISSPHPSLGRRRGGADRAGAIGTPLLHDRGAAHRAGASPSRWPSSSCWKSEKPPRPAIKNGLRLPRRGVSAVLLIAAVLRAFDDRPRRGLQSRRRTEQGRRISPTRAAAGLSVASSGLGVLSVPFWHAPARYFLVGRTGMGPGALLQKMAIWANKGASWSTAWYGSHRPVFAMLSASSRCSASNWRAFSATSILF